MSDDLIARRDAFHSGRSRAAADIEQALERAAGSAMAAADLHVDATVQRRGVRA